MAHENLKGYLINKPGKVFVADLTHRVYDWSVKISSEYYNYRIFEEVSIREDAIATTKLGLDYRPHYRFDCVFFIEPGYRALNQRQVYTVGVELKNSKQDLMGDDKMEHYLGYTDFFFIGVPSELVNDAIERAYGNDSIGVFSVDDGIIHFLPERMKPTIDKQRDLLEQIMYSKMFDADFKNNVSFKLEDIEIVPPSLNQNVTVGLTATRTDSQISLSDEPTPPHPDNNTTKDADERPEAVYAPHEESVDDEIERTAAREKEQQRQQKHNAKVAVIRQELDSMNEEVPSVVVSILDGLSLGDQRIYHVIRKNGGIQAQAIADMLPEQDGIDKPSLATIKRSISALTDAGLIEREGSRTTGQYIVKEVDCEHDNCQVCAKSPLCKQFQQVD